MKKVLIGSLVDGEGSTSPGFLIGREMFLESIRQQYGRDVVFYTSEEAKAAGLSPSDFDEIPVYTITRPGLNEGIENVKI